MVLDIDNVKIQPKEPGVYIFFNKKDEIIYVGKAKDLKKRLLNYVSKTKKTEKTRQLILQVSRFEVIQVVSENEALLLEINLIQKHQPKYNIKLKNKNSYYPYIKISKKNPFPFFQVSFNNNSKSHEYFGPFPEKSLAYTLSKNLNEIFKLRTCSDHELKSRVRPCIRYEMNLCSAPCVKSVDYKKSTKEAKKLMTSQNFKSIISTLEDRMNSLAQSEDFENASVVRDQIIKLKKVQSAQIITDPTDTSSCLYVYFSRDNGFCSFSVGEKNSGNINSIEFFQTEDFDPSLDDSFYIEDFLSSFLIDKKFSTLCLESRLSKFFIETFKIKQKKINKKDLKILSLLETQISRSSKTLSDKEILEIQNSFNLQNLPYKIECFDISHLSGSFVVGAKSCLINGVEAKNYYRKYKLNNQENNDFKNLREIVSRRLKDTKDPLPDLMVIDGGLGQLQTIQDLFKEQNIQGIDLISLAKDKTVKDFSSPKIQKKQERVFLSKGEQVLSPRTISFKIITKARNEAHRFAIKYHRQLRSKNFIKQ